MCVSYWTSPVVVCMMASGVGLWCGGMHDGLNKSSHTIE